MHMHMYMHVHVKRAPAIAGYREWQIQLDKRTFWSCQTHASPLFTIFINISKKKKKSLALSKKNRYMCVVVITIKDLTCNIQ